MKADRLKSLPKELVNYSYFLSARAYAPLSRRRSAPDVALVHLEHPIILPFMMRANHHLGLKLHLLKPGADFSAYRKVIIPNGQWPKVKKTTESIDPDRRVYCEVGFFPQNGNVYFDADGVHGHSSIRDAELPPLTPEQRQRLDAFRDFYTNRDFMRRKWDTVEQKVEDADDRYDFDFVFVPLQLESDTAFDLCPFDSNQQIIDHIQASLPDEKLVFKVHPLEPENRYHVSGDNVILPPANRDLRALIRHCRYLVGSNSTVILEALLYGKKCATLGTGFSTNQHVTLECQDDLERLPEVRDWEPDADRVDRFLSLLLDRQIPLDFHTRTGDMDRFRNRLRELEVLVH